MVQGRAQAARQAAADPRQGEAEDLDREAHPVGQVVTEAAVSQQRVAGEERRQTNALVLNRCHRRHPLLLLQSDR